MIENPQRLLKDKERIDDLERNGYGIIQRKDGFCFGMDAVLLSGFVQVKLGEKVLDLGTGTGIIPILLEAKTAGRHFTGEAQCAFKPVRGENLYCSGGY